MIEHEVKLEVDPGFVMPDLAAGVGDQVATELADHHLDAVYFDRVDGRLLDLGITVRRRTGEGTRWTVKLPAEADEHAGGAAGSVARREVEFHTEDEGLPPDLTDLLAPYLEGGALQAVARLRSHRRRWHVATGAGVAVAEVDDDTVTAEVPGGSGGGVTFREVEIEFGSGTPPARIDALVDVLVAAGARPGDPRSKVERSLALLGRR